MAVDAERLDYYYELVTAQILQYQSLAHGLFPLSISNKTCSEGHVRDSVYCSMSIWALALAYRNVDNDEGRTHELEHSAVKCMRGILFFYMRQANKVEAFKKDQKAVHSLHCKFDIPTTNPKPDENDLQMDVVALYLLTLVQMIASGLSIIFTIDEVNFIQNLVYYIERTYRIADFGVWERGTKYNNGNGELHASSIGMVIAALEAINGFNLFGSKGNLTSVIYVDPDAHMRNKSTLSSLLPRESDSKPIDAALLTVIGFPAFAIHDPKLRSKTRAKVISKLMGRFGLKRFRRDGYGTVIEDTSRKFYQQGELQQFENVECEWPMFYIYLALEAIFNGDATGGDYLEKLEPLLTYTQFGKTIPKYYYVAKDDLALERKAPGEAVRWPNTDLEDTFLWGQSLLIIANLLVEKLIMPHDLDPACRSSQANNKNLPLSNLRYSTFQASGCELVIQVCLISESRTLQAHLATYGVETQTPKEIEPIVICPPHDLVQVFEELGKNYKLQLSGRPQRPLGVLCTSKIYRIVGKTVVTYPILLDEKSFYMSLDMSLCINDLKNSLQFVKKNWNMKGRPIICYFLRDYNFRGRHASEMVDFMSELKSGNVNGVKIKLGRLQTLMSAGVIEHLDYLEPKHCASINVLTNEEEGLYLSASGFESTYQPLASPEKEYFSDKDFSLNVDSLSTQEILPLLNDADSLSLRMYLLQVIQQREGPAYTIADNSVEDCITDIYLKSCYIHAWSIVRRGASLLGKSVASLAPSITTMLVHGKLVSIGAFGHQEYTIFAPVTPAEIKSIIYDVCMSFDPREVSLQQEMVIYLANIISTEPELFDGILKIRVGWIIEAMKHYLTMCDFVPSDEIRTCLYKLYPKEVQHLTVTTLRGRGKFRSFDVTPRNMLEKRQLEGALGRVPSGFYRNVWDILKRSYGLKINNLTLPQQPILTEMTVDETRFKLRVEEMLLEASNPVDRQMLVEVLMVVIAILSRNPEIQIQSVIDLSELVDAAIKLYLDENPDHTREDFFMLEQSKKSATMSYLARSFVTNVLNNSLFLHSDAETNCCVS